MGTDNVNNGVTISMKEKKIYLGYDGYTIVLPFDSRYVFHTNDGKIAIKLPFWKDMMVI